MSPAPCERGGMKSNQLIDSHNIGAGFDLFRLSKAKEVVGLCYNTLRKFNAEGLPFYRAGKAVFVSKAELAAFIRAKSAKEGGSR